MIANEPSFLPVEVSGKRVSVKFSTEVLRKNPPALAGLPDTVEDCGILLLDMVWFDLS